MAKSINTSLFTNVEVEEMGVGAEEKREVGARVNSAQMEIPSYGSRE